MYSEGGPGPPLFLATNILLEFTYRNLNYDRVHPHFFGRCMLKNCMKLKEVLGTPHPSPHSHTRLWDFEDRQVRFKRC